MFRKLFEMRLFLSDSKIERTFKNFKIYLNESFGVPEKKKND